MKRPREKKQTSRMRNTTNPIQCHNCANQTKRKAFQEEHAFQVAGKRNTQEQHDFLFGLQWKKPDSYAVIDAIYDADDLQWLFVC